MYTVIGTPKTRAFRVIWMLEELGVPYRVDPVPPRDPRLSEINPSGKVPILQDGTDYVIDSVAICQYLADKHQALTFPAGTIARAHQDSFTQFAVDDVESCLWTAAKHTFVLPKEMRIADVKTACQHDFDRSMGVLAHRLGDRTYVMGDTFTLPDLLLGHLVEWAKRQGWTVPDGAVAAYANRVMARPAALRAQAAREAA
jgi:glutathione S-transferase